MPIGQKRYKNAYLIPDLMYAIWLKYGSLRNAANWLKEKGIVSSTGKEITPNALSAAAKKSPYYKTYIQTHAGQEVSDPTKEELRQANELIEKYLQEQQDQIKTPVERWQKPY